MTDDTATQYPLCPECGGDGDDPDDLSGIAICSRCSGTGFDEGGHSDPRPDPRTHPEYWTE